MTAAVRMMLPVQEHTHDRPCPACHGHGVTGRRYEMPTGAAADLQAPDVVLLLEVFCPACGGCGNGDPEHAGCEAAWHPDPGDDDQFDDDDPDDDLGDGESACWSCGSGRGWFPIQGFTEGPDTEMYTLRGICSCATDRLVPEGSQPVSTTPAAAVHTGTMSDEKTDQPGSYGEQAAAFIAGVERHAGLGLPVLPDDPAAAAAMRAAGYDVLAEVIELDWPVAIVQLASEADEDDGARHAISGPQLAAALGVTAAELDAGLKFLATMRETPETGPVLSGFRPVPAPQPAVADREMTIRCLLLVGDQAELVADGGEPDDIVRWPAAAIAADTGLPLEDLPGRRFRARVTEQDGRVLFSAFSALG